MTCGCCEAVCKCDAESKTKVKSMDQLYKEYAEVVDLHGDESPRQRFLVEVGRYLWNGWGKTIHQAAGRLVEEEKQWHQEQMKNLRR